jgi:zinc protease
MKKTLFAVLPHSLKRELIMTKRLLTQTLSGILFSVFIAGLITACGKKPEPVSQSQPPESSVSQPTADQESETKSSGGLISSDPQTHTHEYGLANGLKIIIREDHRAPVVVSQVWYKAGSSYEKNGTTGVAHVLEHMMFKGTKKHGPNEFSKIISANGGRENAFTGQDYTAYFQQLEKSRLHISFEMEADRMHNLNMAAEEFAKEVQVVMEERRMRTEDKPESLTYEQFIATAFVNSPYHHPIIGWMNDLKNMTVHDAQDWYSHYYAPNNATLVVVGDVDPEQVFQLAQKYYGSVPTSDIPTLKPQREIEQVGIKRITVKAPAQLPYLVMGYKVPVVKTAQEEWEPYALEMVAHVLDGGDSARFTKNLIRGQQVAQSLGTSYDLYARLEDLFTFVGTPAQGVTAQQLETAIRGQIQQIKDELVSEEELDRIKAQVVASKVYEKDSVFYQAMQIGTLETVGLDWRLSDQYVDKIRAITPEQIQQAARRYLVDDRLTVAVLDPQPINSIAKNMATNAPGGNHAH